MKTLSLCLLCCAWFVRIHAQPLQPGFSKEEYLELLRVFSRQGDSTFFKNVEAPRQYKMIYRSAITGLDNRWDLWSNGDDKVVFSIRGTTAAAISWLENFYAAMVPAVGEMKLSEQERFVYDLSDHPRAAVHVGWLMGLASMASDIRKHLDSCIRSGTRDIVIMGHSQGGAIVYLATAWLRRLQAKGEIPADVRIKTYCSAAPKPGNLYFAYSYEHLTEGGWAFNVVNSADWVPEVPFSVQTIDDFNTTNPFVDAHAIIRKQPFPKDIVMRYVFNHMNRPTRRAQRRFEKYLGRKAGGFVKKQLPGFEPPAYYKSNNYMRAGNMIVLYADADYYKLFPDSRQNVFAHHMMAPYVYLAQKLK